MSRQMDQQAEERERARRLNLVTALEFGLARAIQQQGAALVGFAIKYDIVSCLMTIKADFDKGRHVSFIYSDSMMNCIVSGTAAAETNRLHWQLDKYHKNDV